VNKIIALYLLLLASIYAPLGFAEIGVGIGYERIWSFDNVFNNIDDVAPKTHDAALLTFSVSNRRGFSASWAGGIGVAVPFDGVTEHLAELGFGVKQTGKGVSVGVEVYGSVARISQKLSPAAHRLYFQRTTDSIFAQSTELGVKASTFLEFDFRHYRSRLELGYRYYPEFATWKACANGQCHLIQRFLDYPTMRIKGPLVRLTLSF
jgi:hypothetical protein